MTWFNPLPWGSSTFPVSAATVAFRPGSDAATHGEKSSGYRTTSFLVQFIDIRTGPRATEVPIHQGIAALRRDGFKVRKGLAIFARLFVPALTKPGRGKAANRPKGMAGVSPAVKIFERWAGIKTGGRPPVKIIWPKGWKPIGVRRPGGK
jgi:hypothetical protein